MAAADRGGPPPDHYQLLGVARGACARRSRRRGVVRPGVGVLVPGPAPPGLRDLLPGCLPGYPEQLVQIVVRPGVIRSGHARHLPFRPARLHVSCLQYAPGENLSRGLSSKTETCYIDPVSVT